MMSDGVDQWDGMASIGRYRRRRLPADLKGRRLTRAATSNFVVGQQREGGSVALVQRLVKGEKKAQKRSRQRLIWVFSIFCRTHI